MIQMAGQAHPYNADLSKESEHAAEFQIHVRHSREEKAGHCHGFLSGSYCKEIKELFTLAWPTVLSYFFYHMIHMISLFFAGRIGKLELAAGTLALSFINVTGPSLFIGLGSAVETLCSQAFGARNYRLVGVVLQRGVWILGLTCILAWSLWVNRFNKAFHHQMKHLEVRQKYSSVRCIFNSLLGVSSGEGTLRISSLTYILYHINNRLTQDFVLICIPALIGNFLFVLLQRYLQTQGIVKPILFVCAVTNGIQIGLNVLMVLVFNLGFRGVAISWALTACILTSLLLTYMKVFKLHTKTWPGWTTESLLNWSQFIKLAVSGMAMVCIEWWSFEIGAFLTGTLGEVQLAAFGILFNWAIFVFMIPLGLSVAAGVRVGNFLGAGNPKAVKKTIKVALGLIVSVELIILSLFFGLGDISGRVFTGSSDVLAVYKKNIRIVSVQFFFDGIQGVCSGIVRGAGRQRIGVLINFLSYCVALSLGITLMFFVFHESAGLWIGLLTGVVIQSASYLFLLWRTDWDKQAELAQRRTGAKTVKDLISGNLLNGHFAGQSTEKHRDLNLASWIHKTSSLLFLNHVDADNSQFRLALLSNDGSTSERDSHQEEIKSEATADIKRSHKLTSSQKRALIVKRLIPLVISLMILGGAVALRFLIPLPSSHETSSFGNDTLTANTSYNNLTTNLVT